MNSVTWVATHTHCFLLYFPFEQPSPSASASAILGGLTGCHSRVATLVHVLFEMVKEVLRDSHEES